MCDLKAPQMIGKCSLILELMFHQLKKDNNTVEAPKSICGAKGEGHSGTQNINKTVEEISLGL